MDSRTGSPSARSRDSLLTLRRVERQQALIERLSASRERLTFRRLAEEIGVSSRTIARDIERLRHSGVPLSVVPGPQGGASLHHPERIPPVALDLPEIAALLASLAALGPTASTSAASAMHKLTSLLAD